MLHWQIWIFLFVLQPDTYVCPQCRAPKKRFARYDVNSGKAVGGGLPPIGVIIGLVAGIGGVAALLVYGLQWLFWLLNSHRGFFLLRINLPGLCDIEFWSLSLVLSILRVLLLGAHCLCCEVGQILKLVYLELKKLHEQHFRPIETLISNVRRGSLSQNCELMIHTISIITSISLPRIKTVISAVQFCT